MPPRKPGAAEANELTRMNPANSASVAGAQKIKKKSCECF
jgi:hypothetical protein